MIPYERPSQQDLIERSQKILHIVGNNRLKVHGAMKYRCRDCLFEEWIYLGYGVEGPPDLKLDGTYIPCPFGMTCPSCGGHNHLHVDWGRDQRFATPMDVPLGGKAFVIPKDGPSPDLMHTSCYAGDLYVRGRE